MSFPPNKALVTKVTFFIFFILLFWRMIIVQWAAIIQGGATYLGEVVHICLAYGLISIIIWLNKDELHIIKIDKNFLFIFVFVGFVYSAIIIFLPVRIFLLLVTLINCFYLFTGRLQFKPASLDLWQVATFTVIFLIPLFIQLTWLKTPIESPNDKTIYETAFKANLPLVVFEEVVFRGLLWMFLAKVNLREHQIILVQALLFWLSHFYYYYWQPYTFWVTIPIGSILLGIIVWRSKTITSSLISHYVFNYIAQLYF